MERTIAEIRMFQTEDGQNFARRLDAKEHIFEENKIDSITKFVENEKGATWSNSPAVIDFIDDNWISLLSLLDGIKKEKENVTN